MTDMQIQNLRRAAAKKAQYLTIDAFIASMIVAVTLVIVLAARTSQPYIVQSELISKGFADSLSEVKLKELNNPLVITLSRNGTITNPDNTILQQAAEFYVTGQKDQAFDLLKNVTHRLIAPQYSFKILINHDLIYNRSLVNENMSATLISSKKLVFGVINRTALVYGPTTAEVMIWQ